MRRVRSKLRAGQGKRAVLSKHLEDAMGAHCLSAVIRTLSCAGLQRDFLLFDCRHQLAGGAVTAHNEIRIGSNSPPQYQQIDAPRSRPP
jgi:hypothetical protein